MQQARWMLILLGAKLTCGLRADLPSAACSPTHSYATEANTPSWWQSTPQATGPAMEQAPMRAPWRATHQYTHRLPRHDEYATDPAAPAAEGLDGPDTPAYVVRGRLTPATGLGLASFGGTDGPSLEGLGGTSYMRYQGDYILPATHLPYNPHGPAVWRVSGEKGLVMAVSTLLREPLERRSRGHAAAQAAAKLASGLVGTVWHVLDEMVVAPALTDFARTMADGPSGR